MVSLWKDPTGEVKLSDLTPVPTKSPGLGASIDALADDAKIAELKRTINSLKAEIRAVSFPSISVDAI